MKKSEEKVPPQQEGAHSDITHTVETTTLEEAGERYLRGRQNLLNINQWHSLAGKLSARFYLADPAGQEVERLPLAGDYIKIHLPTSSKDKFDWVRIEQIQEEHPRETSSRIMMQVRPSDPPAPMPETEHFFSRDATSSFFVERNGNTISATVRGRNELPNLETPGLLNKVRNTIVALGAMAGLNAPQWKALTKGILEDES